MVSPSRVPSLRVFWLLYSGKLQDHRFKRPALVAMREAFVSGGRAVYLLLGKMLDYGHDEVVLAAVRANVRNINRMARVGTRRRRRH